MQLEDYFDFLAPDDIRIKGHRIGMENILYEYIHGQMTAEELAQRFDTLSIEKVYAALLYYHANKEAMDKYLADWLEYCRVSREESYREHSEFYDRLRQLKQQKSRSQSESA